ncbi:hypothetical protein BESB_070440 [Besnoitia besnoiti]|uniref:Uncharacterized protein n=1 Tax=Besnoitia besnoiti TaxID=94643 RepID=A0A2A9MES8_BESBE|nr:uncharacterized protein BESB_070440 [Besnoitia besnoiti]PFH33892.1 hypothetical protein BESB_070440 [Besnoitia besnoiti]
MLVPPRRAEQLQTPSSIRSSPLAYSTHHLTGKAADQHQKQLLMPRSSELGGHAQQVRSSNVAPTALGPDARYLNHSDHGDGQVPSSEGQDELDGRDRGAHYGQHVQEQLGSPTQGLTADQPETKGIGTDAVRKQLARANQLKQLQSALKQIEALPVSQGHSNLSPQRREMFLDSLREKESNNTASVYSPEDSRPVEAKVKGTSLRAYHMQNLTDFQQPPIHPSSTATSVGSLPFILPLYNSSFSADTPYMNTSQLLPTNPSPLPALTNYYSNLGNVTNLFPLIRNVTSPINETIGVDTVTEFLQSVLDEETRNKIVAATPPRVFGRLQELFWGTAVRSWRLWVDGWRDFKENPPQGWGWKREEAEGYQRIYNELASWVYDAPFSVYDVIFNTTVLYSFPILAVRGEAIARRDEVLSRDMEKQAIFYAPIFYSSRSIREHIDYFKELLFSRIDSAIQPVTTVTQIGRQFVANSQNAGNLAYGLLQVCALNPECCRAPARCYPIVEENRFKNINLKTGIAGI